MFLNQIQHLKKKQRGSQMYKFLALIALIAIFCFKQLHDSKTYKVEFENQLEFNAHKLQAVIADVWNINN